MDKSDKKDRQLLDLLQSHVPLTPRPYEGLGISLGLPEEEVLTRLQRLKGAKVLRQIGAIFESSRLGYHSTLAAFQIDPSRLDEAASRLNAHPGISHNYARDHRYNLWFTLTLLQFKDLKAETANLAEEVQARDPLYLPALSIFKIEVRLRFSEDQEEESPDAEPILAAGEREVSPMPSEGVSTLSPQQIRAVKALQIDLPLRPRPFQELAGQAGMGEEQLLEVARDFLARGVMRRFAATLHHRRAGFAFNYLVVWRVAEGQIQDMGRRMASLETVSHCYQRPTYPQWPYSLYTMLHARTREEADAMVAALVEVTALGDYLVLPTIKEYKKERFQYFQEEQDGAEI